MTEDRAFCEYIVISAIAFHSRVKNPCPKIHECYFIGLVDLVVPKTNATSFVKLTVLGVRLNVDSRANLI